MDGGNALPDAKAGRGEYGDELECAPLQLETGHEHHRYPLLAEGVNGLKTGLCLRVPMIWRVAGGGRKGHGALARLRSRTAAQHRDGI